MRACRRFVIAFGVALALVALACSKESPSQPSCTYSISSSTLTFSSSGGSGTATVATGAGCAWTAAADSAWVTFPSGNSGSGPATLSFGVGSNSAFDARKATLTVAGQALSVSQEGRAPCEYAVTPSTIDLGSSGGPTSLNVTTAVGCNWTASASVPWVTIATGASGSGNGTVTVTVASNSGTDQRESAVTVAGQSIPVRQEGAAPQPVVCDYSVSPVDSVVHWHATALTLAVATSAGCRWTASSSDGWLSVDRTSGSGPATITASFPTFTEDATRRAAVQVRWPTPTAGQNSWITQEGCRYGVAPSASFTAAGGNGMVTVVTQPLSSSCATGCPWTASSNASWIRVTSSMPRAGDDVFAYQVDANTGPARVGTITIAGRTHTVSQSGT